MERCRCRHGLGRASAIIEPHDQYLRLGRTEAIRREAYRALFRAHVDEALTEEIRSATNGNYALGSSRFQRQIEAALGQRAKRGISGRSRKVMEKDEQQGELL